MSEWNATLSECSTKLMRLIIQQEEVTLTELNMEIEEAKVLLAPHANSSEYEALRVKMENNLKKLEDHIMDIKKSKFNRDILDYQKIQVYTRRRAPEKYSKLKPILKHDEQKHPGHSTPRAVSFSDLETSKTKKMDSTEEEEETGVTGQTD